MRRALVAVERLHRITRAARLADRITGKQGRAQDQKKGDGDSGGIGRLESEQLICNLRAAAIAQGSNPG